MKDDINYAEKIATFNLLVGNTNEDIAFNYLTLAKWDETQAAILYNKENKGSDATLINTNNKNINQNMNQNNESELSSFEEELIYAEKLYSDLALKNSNKISNKLSVLSKYNECEIYENGFLDGLKFWKADNRGYFVYFQEFKNCYKLYGVFINNLKTNVGIIYLYDKRTITEAITTLRFLNNNDQTKDLINSRCVIHPMINKCAEASSIIKKLKINTFPTMVICFYKNHSYFSIISKISNIKENIPLLTQKLIEAHDLFNQIKITYKNPNPINPNDYINNNNNSINPQTNDNKINSTNNQNNIINNNKNSSQNILDDPNNYIFNDEEEKKDMYPYMSDGDVLKIQEEEMKSLERKEEEKVRKKKEEEENKKKEEERKKREEIEEKNKIEKILKHLPQEPSDDDPNKCIIMFRFPDGEKTVQRKFLKTDKVSLLYIYVKSLGREIYNEKSENNFSLVQPFPFKNYNDLQENTLEQEGMFPNAVLQIRTA